MRDTSKSPAVNLVAIALGMAILIGKVSSWLSFRVFDPTPFWTVKSVIMAVGTLLNMILVWRLHAEFRMEISRFGRFIFLTGMIGSVLALIGSSFDLLNTMVGHALILWFPLSQTQSIMVVGYGIVGIWLLMLNSYARMQDAWPGRLAWLGIVTGIIMAVGLFALPRIFIPYVSLSHQLVPELAEIVGNLGWMIMYPIWSVWFGRISVKDPYVGQGIRTFV